MMALLFGLAALLAAWSGMTALCLQVPHQRQRLRLRALEHGERRARTLAGVLLLALSLYAAMLGYGVPFGLVLGLCQAGLAGLVLACALPYRLALVVALARAAALGAALLLAGGLLA
jgi:hypothetical protein